MDAWYTEIINEKNNNRVLPAYIGTEFENPTVLNRNDAKGTPVAWRNDDVLGYWDVKVVQAGRYDVTLQFIDTIDEPGNLHLKLYPQYFVQENTEQTDRLTFEGIDLKNGDCRLEAYYQTNRGGLIFPLYVSIHKLD
jgi:hypothetical protein